MADDFEYEEEYTMEQHYEQEAEQSISDVDPATMIVNIQTPMGPISVDMKQLDDAKRPLLQLVLRNLHCLLVTR